jgi:hypothetical protein
MGSYKIFLLNRTSCLFTTLLVESKKKARCAKATIFFKDYILHMVFMCWSIMHFSYNSSNAILI